MAGKKKEKKWAPWVPSQPDSAVFQIPKRVTPDKLPKIRKPSPEQAVSFHVSGYQQSPNSASAPNKSNETETEASFRKKRTPRNLETPHGKSNAEHTSPDSVANAKTGAGSVNKATFPVPSSPESVWKPDVYAHSFVPESLLAINCSPAIPVTEPVIVGINFEDYIATFAGSNFRPSPREPVLPKLNKQSSVDCLDHLCQRTYGGYFESCLCLDLEAQICEMRCYDLFGIYIEVRDLSQSIYSIRIPGLREGTPTINDGDTFLLRQLILDQATKLPQGMSKWLAPGNGRDRGQPAPGFTGYQISAVVLGIERINEVLIFQAPNLSHSIPLVCNVSFVVQIRVIQRLQNAILSVAQDFQIERGIHDGENNWLSNMLFPVENHGVIQTSLPPALLPEVWYDPGLNYEQKVCSLTPAPTVAKILDRRQSMPSTRGSTENCRS